MTKHKTPPSMKITSLNVSTVKEVTYGGRIVTTGIFKTPHEGPLMLRRLNLDGDAQADLTVHGGPDKAAYAYPEEHYAFWAAELGRTDLTPGQFGENFTTLGRTEDEVLVGDVYRVGGALVEVTQPRAPCYKLAIKMEMLTFPKLFLQSLRTGFYMRVLEEGTVSPGDSLELAREGGMAVREICRLMYFATDDIEGAARAAGLEALSPTWREPFRERVEAAGR